MARDYSFVLRWPSEMQVMFDHDQIVYGDEKMALSMAAKRMESTLSATLKASSDKRVQLVDRIGSLRVSPQVTRHGVFVLSAMFWIPADEKTAPLVVYFNPGDWEHYTIESEEWVNDTLRKGLRPRLDKAFRACFSP